MANRLGDDYKLYVDNGSTQYFELAGQTGLTLGGPQDFIEQQAKGDTYKIRVPGRPDRAVSITGNLRLPDPNGIERAFYLAVNRTAAIFQIRVRPFTGSDVVFSASMYAGNFQRDLPDQQNATYSFDLTLNTQPTVDILGG
jgi:hypothetical protein